eukprot:TRINITY_DN3_c0_g1_i1.p1 TRINITY_DN3_c0_g1~~TRINITY_DN3_c0_g1_i1.p1  ORF type:complete len:502 (-),score=56.32 TRINITY_DN3_c0_g1_i1:138-1643(-)
MTYIMYMLTLLICCQLWQTVKAGAVIRKTKKSHAAVLDANGEAHWTGTNSTEEHHWVVGGDPKNQQKECLPNSAKYSNLISQEGGNKVGLLCCDSEGQVSNGQDDGSSISCKKKLKYDKAVERCQKEGMTLCSLEQALEGAGSGCAVGHYTLWTSSTCIAPGVAGDGSVTQPQQEDGDDDNDDNDDTNAGVSGSGEGEAVDVDNVMDAETDDDMAHDGVDSEGVDGKATAPTDSTPCARADQSNRILGSYKLFIHGGSCQTFSYCRQTCLKHKTEQMAWIAANGVCHCRTGSVLKNAKGNRRRATLRGHPGCTRDEKDSEVIDAFVRKPEEPNKPTCTKVFGEDTGMEGTGGQCNTYMRYYPIRHSGNGYGGSIKTSRLQFRSCNTLRSCQQKCSACKDTEGCGFECNEFEWQPKGGYCIVSISSQDYTLSSSGHAVVSGPPSCTAPNEEWDSKYEAFSWNYGWRDHEGPHTEKRYDEQLCVQKGTQILTTNGEVRIWKIY